MKVAHLTTVDMSLRYLLLAQMRAVIDGGGEVIGISAPGPWVDELESLGIRHRALGSSTRSFDPLADLRAARELWQVLRDEAPDVLHTHNPKPGLYGRVVGRLAGVPIVVNTVHGLYAAPDDRWVKRMAVYTLEGVAARFSDAELVQNPEDLAQLHRWWISPRAQLLGNGVDLARFDRARVPAGTRDALRSELGIRPGQVAVTTVGRLVREKGYPELLAAMRILDPDRFVLVCVGGDDSEKADALPHALVESARAHGVRVLGHRDDVVEILAASDVFVLASHREGFPRAAMEAAAMGLPIVATDVRGCREVVEQGVNGVLVPVRDPVAIASAVESFADEARRAAFGQASRARARAHFDERAVVEKVLATYARLARAKDLAGSGSEVEVGEDEV